MLSDANNISYIASLPTHILLIHIIYKCVCLYLSYMIGIYTKIQISQYSILYILHLYNIYIAIRYTRDCREDI